MTGQADIIAAPPPRDFDAPQASRRVSTGKHVDNRRHVVLLSTTSVRRSTTSISARRVSMPSTAVDRQGRLLRPDAPGHGASASGEFVVQSAADNVSATTSIRPRTTWPSRSTRIVPSSRSRAVDAVPLRHQGRRRRHPGTAAEVGIKVNLKMAEPNVVVGAVCARRTAGRTGPHDVARRSDLSCQI